MMSFSFFSRAYAGDSAGLRRRAYAPLLTLLATAALLGGACASEDDDPFAPGGGLSDSGAPVSAPDSSTAGPGPGPGPGASMGSGAGADASTTPSTGGGQGPAQPGSTGGSDAGGSIGGQQPNGEAGVPVVSPEGGVSTGGGSEADYKDPGKGPWEKVTPDKCKLDVTKLADSAVGNYAIFRYGKLCHMKGGDAVGDMFSVTKTLGGTMAGRAAYLTKDVMRTGPGTGTIKHEDKATDWLGSVSYNAQATLAHVMAMCGHSRNLAYGSKTYTYDTVGSTQINTMINVTEKAIRQVPGLPTTAGAFLKAQIFDKMGMTNSSWSPALGIASGWRANLSDMGKLGTLLVHDGYYGGERLLAREWVYRMSHPAFEDANTSYGQLAWLNHRGNAAGIGGNITSGANAPQGDPCAPAAFWPMYPHEPSGAPDCRATVGTCKQTHDVGVFSAQGLNGQFIVMHPGLDLVIAARNFSGGDGPMGLWKAVRPALVAMDPKFNGDEAAFCKAYGAGDYAPDLVMPRHP